MDNLLLQKIKDLIDKNDKIGIAVGKNPTIDTMASALTLYLGLLDYGKRPSIASASQPLVEHSSLIGIDKVKSGFEADGGAGGDLVVSFPYREGEIEKVSYTIESGYLNIVVKAGEQGLTFNESDVKFRRGGATGAPTLLFIIGTSRLSDLGQLFDTDALKNTAIVNIDNKIDNQGYGDVPAVLQNSASVSEMVASLLIYLGIDPTVDMAQNILNGITDGTNNMQDPRVNYSTFELVANLMKKGANRAPITQSQPQMARPEPAMAQAPYAQRQQPFAQRPTQQYPRPQSGGAGSSRFSGQQPRPGGFQRPNLQRSQYGQGQFGVPASRFSAQDPYAQSPQGMPPRGAGQQYSTQPDYQQPENMQPEMPRQEASQRPNMQRRDQGQDRKPPSDWLTPKVYKGSSNV